MQLSVYTDGGASGNPGPAGWAAILLRDGAPLAELSGGSKQSTNNRMELAAAIKALEYIKKLERVGTVTIYTDSQYLRNGITAWIQRWRQNGWKTAQKKAVLNQDLWQWLDQLNQQLKPQWSWVKGHAGNPHNERCDQLVAKQRKRWSEIAP